MSTGVRHTFKIPLRHPHSRLWSFSGGTVVVHISIRVGIKQPASGTAAGYFANIYQPAAHGHAISDEETPTC